MTENPSEFHDDLSFKPELCRDILNPSVEVIHMRLEAALRAQQDVKASASNRITRRTKQIGPTFHCEVCEENPIYKAPTNVEVKFTQFSKLTHRDMDDALFQRDTTIYQTHCNLMKIINAEQVLFENFLKSLKPKFTQAKTKLPSTWFEYIQQSYKHLTTQMYGQNRYNYRLSTTHVLNVSITASATPTIEKYGQIIAYGTIRKLKLPKLGQQIKCKIESLKNNKIQRFALITLPNQPKVTPDPPIADIENEDPVVPHKKQCCESLLIDTNVQTDVEMNDLGIASEIPTSEPTVEVFETSKEAINVLENIKSTDVSENIPQDNELIDADNMLEKNDSIKSNIVITEENSAEKNKNPSNAETEEKSTPSKEAINVLDNIKSTDVSEDLPQLIDADNVLEKKDSAKSNNIGVTEEKSAEENKDPSNAETEEKSTPSKEAINVLENIKSTDVSEDTPLDNELINANNMLDKEDSTKSNIGATEEKSAEEKDPSNPDSEEKNTSSTDILYKHVKVAISQDLDVFITDVPVNKLGANHRSDISHEDVINFFLGLKVAECIADIESMCNVFSSFPPNFSNSFLFKICVSVQEDKSKYFKISAPLPSPTTTPEHIKHEIVTNFIFKTSSIKSMDNEDDANISFLEYLNDCGAQLIDKQVSYEDIQTQLKEHIEPMKFTSFLPWINLNSKNLDSKVYSLFSVVDTNIIVHSEQPYVVNFQNSLEKAVVYVKPQYCYEYGLEITTSTEYSYLYLKALLLDCVGAVILHVDMKESSNVVEIEKITLDTLSTLFSKAEAIGRLTSFFETLHTLKEGNFVYNHDILQPHSVIYEKFDNEHIQADFHLSSGQDIKLVSYVSPVQLSKTQLTAWQRHNIRLPLCYHPRRPGTYLCHEFLSKESCSNNRTCAFAHLTKAQLKNEMGTEAYTKFISEFERPKNQKNQKPASNKGKNPNFGKILDKRRYGKKRK